MRLTGGTVIRDNTVQAADGKGGGVYVHGGSITYDGVTIGYNSASQGDGVYRARGAARVDGPGGVTFEGGDVETVEP